MTNQQKFDLATQEAARALLAFRQVHTALMRSLALMDTMKVKS